MKKWIWIGVTTGCLFATACATTSGVSATEHTDQRSSYLLESNELVKRGDYFAQRGMYLRAEQYFGAALKQGYPKSKLIPRLVKVCIAGSHYNAALQHAIPYLNAHPREWKLRQLLALVLIATGEHDKAKEALTQVLRDAPQAAFSHFVLASLLRDHFKLDAQAIDHFHMYLELEPNGQHAEEALNAIALLKMAQQEAAVGGEEG